MCFWISVGIVMIYKPIISTIIYFAFAYADITNMNIFQNVAAFFIMISLLSGAQRTNILDWTGVRFVTRYKYNHIYPECMPLNKIQTMTWNVLYQHMLLHKSYYDLNIISHEFKWNRKWMLVSRFWSFLLIISHFILYDVS